MRETRGWQVLESVGSGLASPLCDYAAVNLSLNWIIVNVDRAELSLSALGEPCVAAVTPERILGVVASKNSIGVGAITDSLRRVRGSCV